MIISARLRYFSAAFITLTANYAVDRITKFFAEKYLEGKEPISLLGNTVVLLFTENSGAFLSLGSAWPPAVKYAVLLYIPIGVCLYGLYHVLFRETRLYRVILISSIIGGGLSNLADRLLNDFKVVDFLNFGIGPLRTGILNAADLSVTFGAVILLLTEFFADKGGRQEK